MIYLITKSLISLLTVRTQLLDVPRSSDELTNSLPKQTCSFPQLGMNVWDSYESQKYVKK